jgi:aspartyl-tRNA(Asn)/glutamyl-tRNA(Gln) amidotransferase subunit A
MTVEVRRRAEAALSAAAAADGVFWEVAGEEALRHAKAAAARVRTGAGIRPLDGIPVAVKDAFAVRGLARHLGLARVEVSDRDAAAVIRLREAGAIVIGTTAMDQLGWTMTGQAPGYPRLENPLSPGRSPGGSSGGAAAAVAAGIVPLAIGVDSAGSVRLPAAWCGVVGFKPSFGAIDLDGCAPLAPCLDTAGFFAREVDDCRRAFAALSDVPAVSAPDAVIPRVGIPAALIAGTDCDPAVLAVFRRGMGALERARIAVHEVGAPPAVRGIGAVFAANLAARWGEVVDSEPPDRVHPDVQAGVEYGRSVTLPDYLRACDALAAARRRATSLFAEVDMLAVPASPILPPPLDDPAPVSVASAFTRPWSAFGWPAVTLPCAVGEGAGHAIQFVAPAGEDVWLLEWASRLHEIVARAGN